MVNLKFLENIVKNILEVLKKFKEYFRSNLHIVFMLFDRNAQMEEDAQYMNFITSFKLWGIFFWNSTSLRSQYKHLLGNLLGPVLDTIERKFYYELKRRS